MQGLPGLGPVDEEILSISTQYVIIMSIANEKFEACPRWELKVT